MARFNGKWIRIVGFLLWAWSLGGHAFAGSLIPNGDLEIPDGTGMWPESWSKGEGVTWEKEGKGHFLRFVQTTPGTVHNLYLSAKIPDGCQALRLSFRIRHENIVAGEKPWFDGRIILNFLDAQYSGRPVGTPPTPPHFLGTNREWTNHSLVFMVPPGAMAVEFMPSLFNVKSGIMDLDDVDLRAATDEEISRSLAEAKDREPLPVPPTEPPQKEKWPEELKVVGNRLQNKAGKEVWLQGIVIPSLEWSATGENTLASAKTAIEDWKANILRVEIRDDLWFGKTGYQQDGGASYRALVDAVINLAANRGCYVMLDLHRYRAVRTEHLDFWKGVAAIYKNHPAILFDIFNEPHDISWAVWRDGGEVLEKSGKENEADLPGEANNQKKAGDRFLSPGMQALVDVIRENGARNIIVAAGIDWSYNLSEIAGDFALQDKNGNGIMYSWHVYNWHRDWEKNMLEVAAKYPILVGECGADRRKMSFIPADQQEDPVTWSPRFIAFVQKHRLNWTAFSFHPNCTPVLIQDWKFTPSIGWGVSVKEALSGKKFEDQGTR